MLLSKFRNHPFGASESGIRVVLNRPVRPTLAPATVARHSAKERDQCISEPSGCCNDQGFCLDEKSPDSLETRESARLEFKSVKPLYLIATASL
jgi:hypothetical protein